jgi:hypothetical protein
MKSEIEKILENINAYCRECKINWNEAMTGPTSRFDEASKAGSEACRGALDFAKILYNKGYKPTEMQKFIAYHTNSPIGNPDNCDAVRKKLGLSELPEM